MALWSGLGQASTVAQLVGADAAGLISAILQAVRTARRNRKECRLLARRVMMVGDLLQLLQDSETTRRPEVRRALDGLGGALRQAYELVESCRRGGGRSSSGTCRPRSTPTSSSSPSSATSTSPAVSIGSTTSCSRRAPSRTYGHEILSTCRTLADSIFIEVDMWKLTGAKGLRTAAVAYQTPRTRLRWFSLA